MKYLIGFALDNWLIDEFAKNLIIVISYLIRLFFLINILFYLSNVATATTFYVRPDGNDSNNGTENSSNGAWLTISKALRSTGIKAGDTLRVQNGTYNNSASISNEANETHRITIIGDNNPILDGNGITNYAIRSYTKPISYYTITGISFTNYSGQPINIQYNVQPEQVNISYNHFYNTPADCIYQSAASGYGFNNSTISHNTFSTCQYLGSGTGRGYISLTLQNSTMSNNTFEGNNIDKLQSNGYVGGGKNSIYEYNTFYNFTNASSGKGMSFGQDVSNNNIIRYNNFTNNYRGIRFDSGSHNNTIYGNIFINNTYSGAMGLYPYNDNDDFIISNNTFIDTAITIEGNNTIFKDNIMTGTVAGYSSAAFLDSTVIQNNLSFLNNTLNNTYLSTGGQNGNILNNIFMNYEATGGINGVIDCGNPCGMNISNNVFYNIFDDVLYLTDTAQRSINIKNNIFVKYTGNAINNMSSNAVITSKYNLYYGNTTKKWNGYINDGTGDLFADPIFTNPPSGDFHLRSAYGRWDSATLVKDLETSPAIGAGDPASDNSLSPWGGRIEMGAYGNTLEASRPMILEYGNASGTAVHINQTPLPYANVSLYYQNGVAYGQSVLTGADGSFTFNNILYGKYYVSINKELYRKNISSVFNINYTSIDIGTIKAMRLDVNGDNRIDVLDLNLIAQRFNEKTGTSYPAVDVNGDGEVNVNDLNLVSSQIGA